LEKGKLLEEKFRNWCKKAGIYCQRFYDARSMGRPDAPVRPADFWLWISPKLIFVECKYVNGKSLPFDNFQPSQLKAMMESDRYNIFYYSLIQLKDRIFLVDSYKIIEFIRKKERKSFPLKYLEKNSVEIRDLSGFKRFFKGE